MKVFLCESIHPEALALMESRAEILADWSRFGEADAILNRNLQLTEDVLKNAQSLKVVSVHGTGVDSVDLDYCRSHGIRVVNTPGQNADSVAELMVGLALALLRKLPLADRMLHAGEALTSAPAYLFGRELGGKTVGIIGLGNIGSRAARIFGQGFGCFVIGYSPSLTHRRAVTLGVEYRASVAEVLKEADILCLCTLLNDSTRNLIGAAELAQMKSTAILINASRGGVVAEDALFAALKNGTLGGAACDVLACEPPVKEHPLASLDNVILTPHIGANTEEALRRVGMLAVRQIFDVLDGKTISNIVV